MSRPIDSSTISELDVIKTLHDFKQETDIDAFDHAVSFASYLTGRSEDWLWEYVECCEEDESSD